MHAQIAKSWSQERAHIEVLLYVHTYSISKVITGNIYVIYRILNYINQFELY